MKIPNHILAFLLLLSGVCSGMSALASDRDTGTQIFDPRFRTLKTSLVDLFMSPPVIRLGSDDRILVSFDEIGEDRSYLQCRLVHCNSDWQPSSLTDAEFIDGFNFAEIEDIGYSSNTFVHYINYHIEIPNDHLQIIRSGNYLLEMFDPDDPDTVLLQTRFRVTENAAPVSGTALHEPTEAITRSGSSLISPSLSTDLTFPIPTPTSGLNFVRTIRKIHREFFALPHVLTAPGSSTPISRR